jgi:leucyl aminopeptidase
MFDVKTGRLTPRAAKRAVIAFTGARLRYTAAAKVIDGQTGGELSRSLKGTRFDGNAGEMHRLTTSKNGLTQVLLVGLGKTSAMERRDWWKTGMALGRQLDAMGLKDATLALGDTDGPASAADAALALVEGMHMAMYRFEDFKTEKKPEHAARFAKLTILTTAPAAKAVKAALPKLEGLLAGVDLTRTVANMPPNICNPQYMADEAKKLEKGGLKVEVFDEKQLARMGCNLLLAVGGSAAPADQPRLVVIKYEGAGKGVPYTAIVGKGVCFDTGGYNVKPGASMRGMKFDMSGAAAVLGTMRALSARKAKVNVVGVMICAMNMIGTTPFVMDSVYKAYNGLMVEIGHTDAEGRLCLADAVAYTIDKYQPVELVDLATLTGACMIALGAAYAGLFSTKDSLANALTRAGDETGERLWRLPADDLYMSKSQVADICNDSAGGWGGASVGATFVKKFVGKTAWAHLDIAGTANAEKITGGNKFLTGATGFGVRLLTNWLEGHRTLADESGNPAPRRRGRPPLAAAAGKAKRGRGRPRKAA